ncbi:hypothetical protein SEA_NICEHOUSE_127 [Rhodococcus phage NiceHouse]|nr:hypothetical protein SEA_NICEHOUSE_127 [Rhodococcus phage NiceHouse]
MRAMAFDTPYLIVHKNVHRGTYKGIWLTGPEAAVWIKNHSNPKRIDKDAKDIKSMDPMSEDTVFINGDLLEAKMYKIGIKGVYDTLTLIYDSNSFAALQFIEGTVDMPGLLFQIEW